MLHQPGTASVDTRDIEKYKNKKLPDHPPHSKLISLLKILKLFQSMETFLGTLRTHPKIDLNTHTLNPHTFKKIDENFKK